MYFKSKVLLDEVFNGVLMREQLLLSSGQKHKVVHVTHIACDFALVFDELVKFIEVNIGKKLAGQAPNGQACVCRFIEQRFVGRNLSEQPQIATDDGRRVNGRLGHDGRCHMVDLLLCCFIQSHFG